MCRQPEFESGSDPAQSSLILVSKEPIKKKKKYLEKNKIKKIYAIKYIQSQG